MFQKKFIIQKRLSKINFIKIMKEMFHINIKTNPKMTLITNKYIIIIFKLKEMKMKFNFMIKNKKKKKMITKRTSLKKLK